MTLQPSSNVRGFTTVELLVAVALSLFLLAGVLQVFVSSKQAYRTNDALARMQESGRFALDMIARDVRLAGYNAAREACGGNVALSPEDNPSTNTGGLDPGRLRVGVQCFTGGNFDGSLAGCASVDAMINMFNPIVDALRGYTGTGANWVPALPQAIANLNPAANTDVITMQRASTSGGGGQIQIVKHPGTTPPPSATLEITGSQEALDDFFSPEKYGQCSGGSGKPAGACTVMAMTENCDAASVFSVTNVNQNNGVVNHGTGTAPALPNNRTNILGRNYSRDGGFVFSGAGNETVTYYIAPGIGGGPALWRRINTNPPQEVVEGVESLRLVFGEVTTAGGEVSVYRTASAVSNWDRVHSVRISLLVRSPDGNVTAEGENQVLSFNGAVVNTTDRRLRQVYTTTVAVRNRLP